MDRNRSLRLAGVVPALWLVAACTLIPAAAADPWYAEAIFGRTYLGEDTFEVVDGGVPGTAGIDVEEAFAAGFALGRHVGPRYRVEGEYLYRTNETDAVSLPGGTFLDSGDWSSVAVSANGYVDFLRDRNVRPYFGLGAAWIQEIDIDLDTLSGEESYSGDGFGWQAMAGVQWDFAPRWRLELEARLFDGETVDYDREGGTGRLSADYGPIDILIGLAYRF